MSDETTTSDSIDSDNFTNAQLTELCQLAGVEGRSNLTTKEGMIKALKGQAPELLRPFKPVRDGSIQEGDTVDMNHLAGYLDVQEVNDKESHTEVIMRTKRGGGHALIVPKEGYEVGKNDSDPHLRRWRAGDNEWMNNSTDPTYIRVVNRDD